MYYYLIAGPKKGLTKLLSYEGLFIDSVATRIFIALRALIGKVGETAQSQLPNDWRVTVAILDEEMYDNSTLEPLKEKLKEMDQECEIEILWEGEI